VDDDVRPRLTPYLADRADTMCARRLGRDFERREGNSNPFHRWRVRVPFLDACRAAHDELRVPTAEHFPAPVGLEPEEENVFARAAQCYLELFGRAPARAVDHGCDRATLLPRRDIELGGAVDLVVEDDAGRYELRQFRLWGRPLPADPTASPEIRLAVLRLARSPISPLRELRVSWADLIGSEVCTTDLDLPAVLPVWGAWLDDVLATIGRRARDDQPEPGIDCATCKHVPSCPVHR
jgi:hypothetical protein